MFTVAGVVCHTTFPAPPDPIPEKSCAVLKSLILNYISLILNYIDTSGDTPMAMTRRSFIRIVGSSAVILAAGAGTFALTREPTRR